MCNTRPFFVYNADMKLLENYAYALVAVLLVAFLTVGTYVRTVELSKLNPIQDDEESWIISGVSLLENGYPESWTAFWNTYGTYHWSYLGGKERVVVRPYLDHPPGFQLLIGGWAVVTGNDTESSFNWSVLRVPMIFLALLTIFFTTLFVYKMFSRYWAVLTFLSFVVLPTHIIATRMIAAEHLIVLLMVITLYVLALYSHLEKKVKRHTPWLLVVLCITAFCAPLIKLSGSIVALIAIIYFLISSNYKAAISILVAATAGVGMYIAYGCYFDCNLFWSVMQQHGTRAQTFWYFFSLLGKPDIGYTELSDPFFVIGLVGSFSALFATDISESTKNILRSIWFASMFLFLILAPVELYGWYKYILFPLIAIGCGYVWLSFIKGSYMWSIFLIPAVLLLLENLFIGGQYDSVIRKLLIAAFTIPVFIWIIKPAWSKKVMYRYWAFSILFIALSIQLLWSFQIVFTG